GNAPTINDSGTVAFLGFFTGGRGIFTPSTLLVQAGDTIGGKTLRFLGDAVFNNSGTIAFRSDFIGAGGAGVFTQSALLVQTGDTIGGKTLTDLHCFCQSPINNKGTVAFLGSFADGSQSIIVAQPFAGTPGEANCHGQSVSALTEQFGSLAAAAAALGYSSVQALQVSIRAF